MAKTYFHHIFKNQQRILFHLPCDHEQENFLPDRAIIESLCRFTSSTSENGKRQALGHKLHCYVRQKFHESFRKTITEFECSTNIIFAVVQILLKSRKDITCARTSPSLTFILNVKSLKGEATLDQRKNDDSRQSPIQSCRSLHALCVGDWTRE